MMHPRFLSVFTISLLVLLPTLLWPTLVKSNVLDSISSNLHSTAFATETATPIQQEDAESPGVFSRALHAGFVVFLTLLLLMGASILVGR